jgi:hypothetical protein
MEQFPEKVGLGPKGVELRPEFDPTKVPSNASRGSRLARGTINFVGKILGGIFGAIGTVGGIFIDMLGPVIMPGTQLDRGVCRQHPNNPGCGRPG